MQPDKQEVEVNSLGYWSDKIQDEEKDIIFIYDLKSTSKHFICGTRVVDDVDHLVRIDDFEDVKHKRGLEIKSIGCKHNTSWNLA